MEDQPMYRIEDVAAYILVRQPQPCSAQKIQKLCYYTQAWYLARYGTPLFDHDFEAWRSGPVSPTLYKYHAGRVDFPASELLKVTFARTLSQEDKSFIDKVLAVYDRLHGVTFTVYNAIRRPVEGQRGRCTRLLKLTIVRLVSNV